MFYLSHLQVFLRFCLNHLITSCLLRSRASVLVMLYTSLFLPVSVAFSAAVALPSIQFRLSSLALCFTSLFFALYSCFILCFKCSNLALSILSFASSLSLIFSHVLSPIHGLLCFLDHPITFFAASLSLHFTCPLAPRWRIGPPHVLSIDSCLALQCVPLSRTATLLQTSPFLLCTARLFLAGLSFSFLLGSMSGL